MPGRRKISDAPLTAAQQKLVESCIPLAIMLAGRTGLQGAALEEARSAAYCGLIRAAQGFDVKFGAKFSTYASYHIFAAMQKEKAKWVCQESEVASGRRPRRRRYQPPAPLVSLSDWEVGDGDVQDAAVEDHRTEDARELVEAQDLLRAVGALLDWRSWLVLRMRFLHGLTLRETGDRLGLTRERIRQIQSNAIMRLRNRMPKKWRVDWRG